MDLVALAIRRAVNRDHGSISLTTGLPKVGLEAQCFGDICALGFADRIVAGSGIVAVHLAIGEREAGEVREGIVHAGPEGKGRGGG